MAKPGVYKRFVRFTLAVALGGAPLVASGCDPTVKATVLAGLETTTSSLTNTLISAYFLSIADDATAGLTTTP